MMVFSVIGVLVSWYVVGYLVALFGSWGEGLMDSAGPRLHESSGIIFLAMTLWPVFLVMAICMLGSHFLDNCHCKEVKITILSDSLKKACLLGEKSRNKKVVSSVGRA